MESSPQENNKTIKGTLSFLAIASISIGIIITYNYINCAIDYKTSALAFENDGDFSKFGTIGDFIGGIVGTLFSLSGVFLLYLTLKEQRENFYKERLENNYFELIKFHRENVNELEYIYSENTENKSTAIGRKVFKLIFDQFQEAYIELNHFFDKTPLEKIYMAKYLKILNSNLQLTERRIELKQYAQIDIVYTIIFFGLSRDNRRLIANMFNEKYDRDFVLCLLSYAALKPKKESKYWHTWNTINKLEDNITIFNDVLNQRIDSNYKPKKEINWIITGKNYHMFSPFFPDNYEKYYGGHQFRLGHYYRHLYQSIKYIDNEEKLSYNEKRKYVKIIRGQLSNYEQIIFFLNSISHLGRIWELEEPKFYQNLGKNDHLITKYELIRNIPHETIVGGINIKNYYPKIDYEVFNNNISSARKELESAYT